MTELAMEPKKKGRAASISGAEDGHETQDQRSGALAAGAKKIRLTLQEDDDGPLSQFQMALKDRGVKGVEISDIIAEALSTVPKEWWDAKLEALTPFEFKLHAALENPELRAKLMSLLDTKLS